MCVCVCVCVCGMSCVSAWEWEGGRGRAVREGEKGEDDGGGDRMGQRETVRRANVRDREENKKRHHDEYNENRHVQDMCNM